eukprot:gnl/Dysnectes_brevis/1959_a2250_1877.p1 GENE.gnl/Dysnectes_brevis/1959_a2250_1877~~gnl/Dysnectes_brevis/1959_a2250_1877.p1  ORF type:complete len:540 (+),score=139.05 gnl/Dysnectes_brevis/1959_a2250_1877:50-1669(+)
MPRRRNKRSGGVARGMLRAKGKKKAAETPFLRSSSGIQSQLLDSNHEVRLCGCTLISGLTPDPELVEMVLLRPKSKPVVDVLIELLSDPHEDVQTAASSALAHVMPALPLPSLSGLSSFIPALLPSPLHSDLIQATAEAHPQVLGAGAVPVLLEARTPAAARALLALVEGEESAGALQTESVAVVLAETTGVATHYAAAVLGAIITLGPESELASNCFDMSYSLIRQAITSINVDELVHNADVCSALELQEAGAREQLALLEAQTESISIALRSLSNLVAEGVPTDLNVGVIPVLSALASVRMSETAASEVGHVDRSAAEDASRAIASVGGSASGLIRNILAATASAEEQEEDVDSLLTTVSNLLTMCCELVQTVPSRDLTASRLSELGSLISLLGTFCREAMTPFTIHNIVDSPFQSLLAHKDLITAHLPRPALEGCVSCVHDCLMSVLVDHKEDAVLPEELLGVMGALALWASEVLAAKPADPSVFLRCVLEMMAEPRSAALYESVDAMSIAKSFSMHPEHGAMCDGWVQYVSAWRK